MPITANLTVWYASGTITMLVALVALGTYGFRTSLAGQPVIRSGLLQE